MDYSILYTLSFYLLAAIMVAAAFMVIAARNPVHSVLFLILAFFTAAGLFVLLGAEFLAMIMLVVYVGAVAVLFLFVVMMLDINFTELREGFLQYLPIGGLIGLILLLELGMVLGTWAFSPDAGSLLAAPLPEGVSVDNTESLGNLIYTKYVFAFQMAGVILLVAMIGAIVLTHRQRPGVKRQKINQQIRRRGAEATELRDIPPGQGL